MKNSVQSRPNKKLDKKGGFWDNGGACEANRFSCFPICYQCRPFLRGGNPPKAIPHKHPLIRTAFLFPGAIQSERR